MLLPANASRASRILIIFAHPMPHASRVNRVLIAAARGLPNVTVQDLYETYPDFHIDVAREQALLEAADLIVFQYPVQWYSMPSLLKEWTDTVFEAGWAYGDQGNALRGKDYWMALTTGGVAQTYSKGGAHEHPFDDFLPPLRQTANFCGMRWWPPLLFHGAHQVAKDEITMHAEHYVQRLSSYPLWTDAASKSAVDVTDLPTAN